MKPNPRWKKLGWRHELWELVRYFRSLRSGGRPWLAELKRSSCLVSEGVKFPLDRGLVDALIEYVESASLDLNGALGALRDEDAAQAFCARIGSQVGVTATQSKDHHQSSKALVSAVSALALKVCTSCGVSLNANPQRRAIWLTDAGLHVSARNLDGAVPGLENPLIVWEVKEYWGKTSGGSKMSDAVYECQLVGRELREYEQRSPTRIAHIVFVDGRDQWRSRKSDLLRFVDLFHQDLIDYLIVGNEVEDEWESVLSHLLSRIL